MSYSVHSSENRLLNCSFSEPSFSLEINLDSGKIVESRVNDGGTVENRVIVESALVEIKEGDGAPVIRVQNDDPILDYDYFKGVLNYTGNSGENKEISIVSGTYYAGYEHVTTHVGACTFGALKSFDRSEVAEGRRVFAQDATDAIALCFNRAVSLWAIASSDYLENASVFYGLYRQDIVPGEPGNVSLTFASAESGELFEILEGAKINVEDGESFYRAQNAAWNYCSQYGSFLQGRFIRNY